MGSKLGTLKELWGAWGMEEVRVWKYGSPSTNPNYFAKNFVDLRKIWRTRHIEGLVILQIPTLFCLFTCNHGNFITRLNAVGCSYHPFFTDDGPSTERFDLPIQKDLWKQNRETDYLRCSIQNKRNTGAVDRSGHKVWFQVLAELECFWKVSALQMS